jgi:hypothetical protein
MNNRSTNGDKIMSEQAYIIPVKAIKSILLKEHESFIKGLKQRLTYMLEYENELIRVASESTIERIKNCNTYGDLHNFIVDSRRMSLQEWIDSL